jgi:UDP-N-acetylglucosamine acyltransferase
MPIVVDNRAVVSPKAQLGDNVAIGPFTTIEDDVVIGAGTTIGSNALIANGSRLGRECRIHHGAVLGTPPQDLKYKGEPTTLEVGDHTTIREYATLNRGTHERMKTTVGSHCFIMAYAHVAHDCDLGNHIILANSVNMAGHVTIEDHAIIGGMTPIHQFVRVGQHSMTGGGFRVPKDIPPYVLAGHEPMVFQGLNIVGLKRRNFSAETIELLEKAYHILYQSRLNVSQAVERIKRDLPQTSEIKNILDFIATSKRGIIGAHR